MKLELKKGLPIEVLFFAVTTFIFAVLTLFNLENLLLRIMTQASACLLMLFKGMHIISHQKEKYRMGYLFIGVAAFIFVVMINAIIVRYKTGTF